MRREVEEEGGQTRNMHGGICIWLSMESIAATLQPLLTSKNTDSLSVVLWCCLPHCHGGKVSPSVQLGCEIDSLNICGAAHTATGAK